MSKVSLFCCYCGKLFEREKSKVKRVCFCSNKCRSAYNSEKMSFYNKTSNLMNVRGLATIEQREKLRERKLKDTNNWYKSYLGELEHRRIAKFKLGRELKSNEVVHHIDGDRFNNKPNNLQVMTRAEHMRLHIKKYWADKRAKANEKK